MTVALTGPEMLKMAAVPCWSLSPGVGQLWQGLAAQVHWCQQANHASQQLAFLMALW